MAKPYTDLQSFLDGVKNPLGTLSEACYAAFDSLDDKWLVDASNALAALECVDLDGCQKNHPLPWSIDNESENADTPILDANGEPILNRDCGSYPPDIATCKAIVECMNTVWSLQQHKERHYS